MFLYGNTSCNRKKPLSLRRYESNPIPAVIHIVSCQAGPGSVFYYIVNAKNSVSWL